MIFHIEREYWPAGTNGTLSIEGMKICKTVELPWKRNDKDASCIPEGTYRLAKVFSEKRGWHLKVLAVAGRSDILICPARNVGKDWKGNIVPVIRTVGEGKGTRSRKAFEKFKEIVYAALEDRQEVLLEIKSYPDAALNLARYGIQWME